MRLVIDEGNTSVKTALFSTTDGEPAFVERVRRFDAEYLDTLFSRHDISACIYSSVVRSDASVVASLQARVPEFVWFDADTPLPVAVDYRTPQTLGRDRIAAVVGAAGEAPSKDLLVVDAGTCITYDLLTADGHYRGGNIAPGAKMRLKAMHAYTQKLPLVEKKGDTPALGCDTETAMRAGAVRGICYEIEGYINALRQEYPQLLIFLTGGDAFLLADKLKTPIFVDECIVLKGLNRILQYGKK